MRRVLAEPSPQANGAAGGAYSMRAVHRALPCRSIRSSVRPTTTPARSGTFVLWHDNKLVGATNYCYQHRPEPPDQRWRPQQQLGVQRSHLHGDQLGRCPEARPLASTRFVDGTSNTAIFSEWIKGPAIGVPASKNGLAMIYNIAQNSDAFPHGLSVQVSL